MAAMARVDGQEKVIVATQHIVKSLATSKNAAEDMFRIFSGFDNRLSVMNEDLFPPATDDSTSVAAGDAEPSEAEARLEAAKKVLLRWDPSSCDSLLWESPPEEITDFLNAVDEVISFSADPLASPSSSAAAAAGDRMIWVEYGRELHQVYYTVRHDILDECLIILGVDRMSIEEV